jgi:hypothetical protein
MEGTEGFVVGFGAGSDRCGTATLFRLTISEVHKSLSTKCLLHEKYLQIIWHSQYCTPGRYSLSMFRHSEEKKLQIFTYFQSGRLVS